MDQILIILLVVGKNECNIFVLNRSALVIYLKMVICGILTLSPVIFQANHIILKWFDID